MANNYLPRTDSEKEAWLKNFANKINQYAVKYNIAAAEIADIQASLLHYSFHLNYKIQYGEYIKKLNAYLKEIKDGIAAGGIPSTSPVLPTFTPAPPVAVPGIFNRIMAIVRRIKNHIGYTTADGLDLGIDVPISKKAKPNLETIKPSISLRLMEGGQPEIVWARNGMDALEIWVDRGDGNDFIMLDVDTKPNYTDTTELPEKAALWKYKAIYRLDDKVAGRWSDIVSITVVRRLL